MGRILGRIWVGATLCLISFIGFSSQLCVVLPSFDGDWTSRELLETVVPFNFLLALLFYNYFLCVFTDPGQVPVDWQPSGQDEDGDGVEVKKLTGSPRYCRTCRAYKPPRAHHCRTCKRCVLKMDHHCPWVNNCVGHRNYGHFIRFLFMVDVACTYHLCMITKSGFNSFAFASNPTTLQIAMLVANYATCVPVLIAVGCFSLYHFWCLLVNTTTIEGWEKGKVATLKRRGRIVEYRYPYHLGYLENVRSVLGRNPILWCWPQRQNIGDGLIFRVGTGVDPVAQYNWPPRDPYAEERRVVLKQTRARRLAAAPFTYGTGLNPELLPSNSKLRSRRPHHDGATAESGSEDEQRQPRPSNRDRKQDESDDDDDEDDLPLTSLADRRAATRGPEAGTPSFDLNELEPPPAMRIRRGSEGYEVRPIGYALQPPSEDYSDASWEEGRISEGELDEVGDRMRRGPRYRVYQPEPESMSESEDSLDSMDDYLDENAML